MSNHALLIGIGQRADDSKAIAVTATDATRLAEELEKRGGYNANKIRALVGAKAGKTAILRELDSLIKKTTEQKANLVILFYSGQPSVAVLKLVTMLYLAILLLIIRLFRKNHLK